MGAVIKFDLRIRELNKAYQALNNELHDNGVENKPILDENVQAQQKAKKNSTKNKEEADALLRDYTNKKISEAIAKKFSKKKEDKFKTNTKKAFNVQKYGFPLGYVKDTVEKNDCNFCTTVYYLENKDQSKINTRTTQVKLDEEKDKKKLKKEKTKHMNI